MDETELGVTRQANATATGRRDGAGSERLRRGDALGRYVVIDILGHGGMGVVYAAFDPELGRSVAIKLLHPGQESSLGASGGRGRLLREAQALAQLQHPNVITVHDVGEHDGQIFVAMEHIHGLTLRRWLDAEPRPWREVLAVMQPAGQGLRAAHAKGMVHRDFKPDNVMLATDESGAIERVLVMDFGLATAAGRQQPPAELHTDAVEVELSASDTLGGLTRPGAGGLTRPGAGSLTRTGAGSLTRTGAGSLTRTGAVMGTPAYMAPEQHAGARTDARTDQFAFCLTLYEALYGRRPFTGETLPALVAACIEGRIEAPPRGSPVPRWVREVTLRGLAADPELRWPSMTALLDALAKDPTRARRRLGLAALGVAAIGLAALGSVLIERRRLASCRDEADAIDGVWSAEVRARTQAGVLGTNLTYAQSTWEHLEPLIDDQAERWRTLRYDACVDPQGVPAELRDQQSECFESSKMALADLLEIFAEADGPVLNRASSALGSWAHLTACTSPTQLARRPRWPDEPEARARVVALHREIQRASLEMYAGRFDEAERLVVASLDEAERLEQPRLIAVAAQTRARALQSADRYEEAEPAFEDAFFAARRAGADDLAAMAAAKLGSLVGHDLARPADGRRWIRHAEILADEAELDAFDAAVIDHMSGIVELGAGNFETARDHFEAALAVYDSVTGPESVRAIDVLISLAIAHAKLGERDLSTDQLQRVLTWCEQMDGADHPSTAEAHNNLAVALMAAGRMKDARAHIERAIASYEGAGLEARLGAPLDNLVIVLRETGHPDEALRISARAIEVRRRTLPADHPDIGNALINRGQTLVKLGQSRAALVDFRAALELYERALGPDHPRVGDGAYTLAMALAKDGDHREALAAYQRGLRIRRATLPADHPHIAWATLGLVIEARHLEDYALLVEAARPLMTTPDGPVSLPPVPRSGLMWMFGEALLETAQPDEALTWLERAAVWADDPEQDAPDRANMRFALARARWEAAPLPRSDALVLARSALLTLRAAEDAQPADIARIERWLAEHEPEASSVGGPGSLSRPR